MNDLRISVVLDCRVEPQLADLRTAAATIDDVRRIALRLRALRPAWRAIGVSAKQAVEPPRLSPQGQLVRVDVHVRSNEPLVEQSGDVRRGCA